MWTSKPRTSSFFQTLAAQAARAGAVLGVLATLVPQSSLAIGVFVDPEPEALLADALQVRITESGLDFFQQNLEQILLVNGLDLRHQMRNQIDIALEKPIRLNEVSADFQGEKKSLSDIAETIGEWIHGVELKNPQPRFKFSRVGYEIADSASARFSVLVSPNDEESQRAVQSPTWGGAAVFDIQLTLPKLRLFAEQLSVSDPQNPILGSWVILRPELKLGNDQTPLRLKLRVKVSGSTRGLVSFQVLGANWNLNQVPVALNFQSLTVPKVKVTVSGRSRYLLDQNALQEALKSQLPSFARLGRSAVHSAIHGSLQSSLQTLVQNWLTSSEIGSINLDVPSVCDGVACPKFSQNLQLALGRADVGVGVGQQSGETDLRLRFYADWRDNPGASELSRSLRGFESAVTGLDEITLDDSSAQPVGDTHVVAAVDPRIYNQMLLDSWDAGWRPSAGEYGILAAPQVRLVMAPGEDISFLELPLSIRPKTLVERQLFGACGYQGATDDPFRVDAAVNLEVRRTPNHPAAIDLNYRGILLNETTIDPSQFSSCALTLMVQQPNLSGKQADLSALVRRALESTAKKMAQNPESILQGLELPSQLLGIQLRVERADWVNGRILLHLRFVGVDG